MEGNIALKTARIISTLFIPPTITIFTFAYFSLRLETEPVKQILVVVTSVIFGFIFPILMFASFRRKGKINNPDATIKEERILPFSIGILFYLAGAVILYLSEVNLIIQSFWFCYISNTIIIIFITKYWKISVHALGVSGPLAALFYITGIYSLPLFLF